jgi:NADPH:quinone reductase-like Zn-dependent oxidoreductase
MNTTKMNPAKVISSQMKSATMKAIIANQYGTPDVLQAAEVKKPIPQDNEILIKIHAAAVTTADTMMRTGYPFIGRLLLGFRKPKHPIPGTGLAGEVEAVGKGVKLFEVGDQVFGESIVTFGTYAEYICLPEEGMLMKKPENISFVEAAGVCDGPLTSLNFLKEIGNIEKGQKVLINGASGSLGTAAVQIARHFDAEVTGVCSTKNLEMVKDLGANKVIDYTKSDFTQNGETYDIIYDTVGKLSFSLCKNSLTQKGVYLSPVLGWSLLIDMMRTSFSGGKKAKFSATGALPVESLRSLLGEVKELIEAGKLKAVVDRIYPLEQVAEAHRYIDTGHKKGNVVISFENHNKY